jgi:general secretion pathway protein K
MQAPPGDVAPKRERGFVLVTVLWIAGLLVVLASTFAITVRTHIRVAENITGSATAEMLADAGISLAILELKAAKGTSGTPSRLQPDTGGHFTCAMPREGVVSIIARDEGAVVDLNSAGVPILQALFAGLGEPPDRALALAEAIFDYRDGDDLRKEHGAERPEYAAAGIRWTPKNAPFDSVEELGQVLGMTPKLVTKLRPYVGVHSGTAGVDASASSPDLLTLLRTGAAGIAGTFNGFRDLDPEHALPAIFNTPSQRRIFAIRASGMSASGALFVREAVVDIGPGQSSPPRILNWQRSSEKAERPVQTIGLPPC